MGQDTDKKKIINGVDNTTYSGIYSEDPQNIEGIPRKWSRVDKKSDERKTMINDKFWEDFTLLARVCYLHDSESDLFDVFDTMRTKILGGWEYTPDFLAKLDRKIEEEEQRNAGHR